MIDNLVTIIMPSYDTAQYITESIDSVLAQTYQDWELIIVDDCSRDNTMDILQQYSDKRIRVFRNEQNSGAAVTRNKALREAKGRWIAFLDSDDLWHPEKLEKMLNFMQSNGYSFVYHDYEKINEASEPLGVYVTGPKVVTKSKMYDYDYVGCLTFMYDAKVHGQIQIADIKKNNDYAILLKLCKKADCYLLQENLGKYRIRTKSISHDALSKKLKSHYDLFYICDKQPAPVAFWYACWNMFYGVLKKIRYEKRMR